MLSFNMHKHCKDNPRINVMFIQDDVIVTQKSPLSRTIFAFNSSILISSYLSNLPFTLIPVLSNVERQDGIVWSLGHYKKSQQWI